MSERRRAAAAAAGGLQALATISAAMWFREAVEAYAVVLALASAAALALRWVNGARSAGAETGRDARMVERGTTVLFALAAVLVAAPAFRMARARLAHPSAAAVAAVARAVAPTLRQLAGTAEAALARAGDASLTPARRFEALAPLGDSGDARRGERAVALLDGAGAPVAWAGTWRVRPDSLAPGAAAPKTGVASSPFYVVLYAIAEGRVAGGRGGAEPRRAVAAMVLHAEPPADRLARALDAAVLRESGLRGLDVRALGPGQPPLVGAGWQTVVVPGTADRLAMRAIPPDPAAVRAGLLEDARRVAAPGLALLTVLAAATLWQLGARTRMARASASTAALGLPLAVLALTPLGSLSNVTRLFDPAVYFSPIGGALTSTLGALSATGAVAVLAVATAWRGADAAGAARWNSPLRARGGAALAAAAFAGGAWLIGGLARGISPPPGGATIALFVAWEGAFCLVAAAVLLWVLSLMRPLLTRLTRRRARRSPAVYAIAGPFLGVGVALVGALEWQPAGGWPAWYPALWVIPALAVVFSRAGRGAVPAAIAVAGLGASTLVWGATTARQVMLAAHDVRALAEPEPDATALLARFGRALAADTAPAGDAGGAALLRRYATSPLAAAGYPVALARWDTAAGARAPVERVAFVLWAVDTAAVEGAVRDAAVSRSPVTRAIGADPGAATLLAVPQRDGRVATVTLFPRAQFVTVDPLGTLLGGRARGDDPPYLLSLLRQGDRGAAPATGSLVPPPAAASGPVLRWTRGDAVAHADARVLLPDGPAAAHVEIRLGTLAVLAERAALLVFANLVVVGALWWLPSLDVVRWPRPIRGWRYWTGSYRARLTAALFGFFAVPTLAFGGWTFSQLKAGDREARALLVRETLRAAVADGGGTRGLAPTAARLGAPLLSYDGGVLTGASEPAVLALAPLGRLLPPAQMLSIGAGDEVNATLDAPGALGGALIGFRAALGPGGRRVVLATPARTDDSGRAERRRDLGFFVLLAGASGALAALWLSGVAARQLARPVGSLRRAALALARAGGGPDAARASGAGRGAARVAAALDREPPAEFRPVFGAFRQMAVELDATQLALEAARQRTAAVLRDVASGVIAVDAAACVTVANPRAGALLGRALDVGQPVTDVVPPEIAARVRAFLAAASRHNGASPRGTAIDDNGRDDPAGRDVASAFDVRVRGRELRARLTTLGASAGAPRNAHGDGTGPAEDAAGAVLTLDDVTELAQAQRALAWGEMARQVAHEIKNPLTPIRLGVQLLRRAYRDRRGDFGALLESNAERVLAEIDRLDEIARAFSRYGTTAAHAPPPEPVDVAAIARDVVALERLGGGETEWDEVLPPAARAWARDGELREVVLNLLENARLAGASCVRVSVSTADGVSGGTSGGTSSGTSSGGNTSGGASAVTLAVRDDGHGIPADVLPRIFDPHFSTRTSGSGLGLAIARRLVDAWGGRIDAESTVGEGTCVTVTLRAADVAP